MTINAISRKEELTSRMGPAIKFKRCGPKMMPTSSIPNRGGSLQARKMDPSTREESKINAKLVKKSISIFPSPAFFRT